MEWFSARKTAEVVEHLSQYRVPAAPINTVEQAASDPHLHQRKILVEVSDPVAGRIHVPGEIGQVQLDGDGGRLNTHRRSI